MHQSTQRRICRMVFLAGCVLPTLAVTAWTAAENLPSTTDSRLARIERALGLRVTAAAFNSPTPGLWRIREVQLADVETGEPVLTADRVEWQAIDDRLTIRLQGAHLAAEQLPRLASTARDVLAVDWPHAVVVEASRLAWLGESGPAADALLGQRHLRATLETRGTADQVVGRQLVVELRTAADPKAAAPRIEVHRNRQRIPPASRVTIDTAGQAVPAAWLAQLDPLLPAGGSRGTFTGRVSFTTDGHRSHGQLQGALAGVQLAGLLQLPIDATADLSDLEVRWEGGRVTRAQGVVQAGPGSMDVALAQTLASLYQTPQPGAQPTAGARLPFGTLGAAFVLNDHALSIWGACPADDPLQAACLLDADGRPLFGQPDLRASLSLVANVLSTYGDADAPLAAARLPRSQPRR